MNNKILARIVAVVMAVAMLGTVSFAADDYPTSTPEGTITDYTVMVFYAAEATVGADKAAYEPAASEILYLDQNTTGYPTGAIDVAYAETAGNALYVRYGNDLGTVQTRKIGGQAVTGVDADVWHLEGDIQTSVEFGGKTYVSIVMKTAELNLKAGATVTEYGIKFGKFGGVEANYPAVDGATVTDGTPSTGSVATIKSNDATLITGEGTVTFTAIILGVPADKAEGLTAHAYATYAQN